MSFLDHLSSVLERKKSHKAFKELLVSSQNDVLNVGLCEEEIHLCVQIFLEHELSQDVRQHLLNCLVPRVQIPADTTSALLAWFFSNYSKNIEASKSFLKWLSVMLANNLIDKRPCEALTNQFLMCFYFSDLVIPVCSVLKYILGPGNVTPRSVYIAQFFYNLPLMSKDKTKIAPILRLLHDNAPSLLPNPPSGNASLNTSTDSFHKSVSNLAFRLGFLNTVELGKRPGSLSDKRTTGKKSKKFATNSDCETLSHLSHSHGLKHLGWMIRSRKIPELLSISSVIGSQAGQIYVSWLLINNHELPLEDRQTVIPILGKVLEVCQRTRSGFPILSPILSRYLMVWDGNEDQDVIYGLLSWIDFETFEDLYANVLCHLVNLFFTVSLKEMIRIIYCLTDLIANKIRKVSPATSAKLIAFVSTLIKASLAKDGLRSSVLLLACLKFYQCMSCLEERYTLHTWTIPPTYVVFGSLFSENCALISEICELIVRHNAVMYPHFISLGMIQDFKVEEEIIKTYLRDLYLFLWKGQASSTDLISYLEDNMGWIISKENDSLLSVRSHHGIEPFVSYVAQYFSLDPSKRLNDKSLLRIFNKYAPGLSAVKTAYEVAHKSP